MLDHALAALREKSCLAQPKVVPPRPRKKLYDLSRNLPLPASELNLERQKDRPRPVNL